MFKDINFRYTDAQEEKSYSPEIIEETFVDVENILEEILRPERFLVVGAKGAGKSALSSKLQIDATKKWNLFITIDDLEQFNFNLLSKSTLEKTTGINGIINVWQLLLFIRFISLFLSDQKVYEMNIDLINVNNSLKKNRFNIFK